MGINLVNAEYWLLSLKCFLWDTDFTPAQKKRFMEAEIVPSVEAQREHKKAARSFCFTRCRNIYRDRLRVGQKIAIFTAPEIEMLPHKFICGILLHELGHVVLWKRIISIVNNAIGFNERLSVIEDGRSLKTPDGFIESWRAEISRGAEEEVAVDTWAVSHGLGYEYNDLRLKDGRTAYSLQHVSRDGVTRIRRAGK
jgi:hypothetical protein